MEIGTSPITGVIYIGNTRVDKQGFTCWTKKTDMTENTIKSVFEHMYLKAEETGAYEVSVEGFGKMTFVRE